jgi:putative ABC transport system permease protein
LVLKEHEMERLRIFVSRLLGIFAVRRRDDSFDTELGNHLELLTEENVRRGMSPQEARYAARREFGGLEQTKQAYREQRGLPFLDTLLQDLHFGLRLLSKDARLSLVIVAILAVGIGAGTSLYSLIDACLIRSSIPQPVKERWDVVQGYLPNQKRYLQYMSAPEIAAVKQLTEVFESVGAVHGDSFNVTRGEYPERVLGTHISASGMTMTHVAPILGRTFREDEDRPGGPRVVVLSYELWQHRFSGDANVLGRSLWLNDLDYTVIGVMPRYFDLWGGELWIPAQIDFANNNRADRQNWIVAVLREGVTEQQANARLRTLAKEIEQHYGSTTPEYRDWELRVWNIKEAVIGGVKPALLVLAGAVGLLILIVCFNVGVLLLARATSRLKEIALRTALGATRWRLLRQLLTESLLLGFAGGAAGVILSVGCLPLLVHMIPREWLPIAPELVRVDHNAIAVACLIAAVMGVLFGTAPALQVLKENTAETLKEAGSKVGGSRFGRLARNALITCEIALSVVVLSGAALMGESYRHLEGLDLGFRADHLLRFMMSLPATKYSSAQQIASFFGRALEQIRSVGGVQGAAAVSGAPMVERSVDSISRDFTIEGRPGQDARGAENANLRIISSGYFETIGARVVQGRTFSDRDGREAPRVAIINQTMARMYWSGANAVGSRIQLGRQYGRREAFAGSEENGVSLTIVGVVSDVRQVRVIDVPVRQEIYVPLVQQSNPPRIMTILIRSLRDPAQLTRSARDAIQTVDAEQPIYDAGTMEEAVADSFGPKRLTLFLLVFLSGMVLVLACTGLHATLSYSVGQRRQEIGIRMAVGASHEEILRLVVFEGAKLGLMGVGAGVVTALAMTRLMQVLLYQVDASDPLILGGTGLALISVALLASYLPARRATNVNPTTVLQ